MGTLGSQGVVSAFVRLHPLLNPAPIEGVGELVTHGATVSIDLTLPWDEYLRQLRCNHRRDIAKAMRHGLVARTDDEFEHYRTFTSLYAETMERRSASRFYRFNDRYFDGLRRSLGERLHLIVVEEESAIVAAGLFVETSGTVQYHLGGSTGRLRTAEASKLMIHFATSWARERGNHSLHLGGGVGGSDDSLLHFKTGFSALRHPFRTLRVVIDRAEYVHLVRIHAPIAEPAALRGYFPAYRTE
jgi:lipid II:glycine glycyltransferase (peptidoglycan interpeptide bridge formation enzyme)